MKNNKKEQDTSRKLKRNFFREAMIRELNLEYRRQLSEHIKQGMRRKKLSTD